MKVLKSIFRLFEFMWPAIRCRAFSFLLTILQILLTCSSNFSSESKVIQSNFSLRLDAIHVLSKQNSLCVFEFKITWRSPGLAFIRYFYKKIGISHQTRVWFCSTYFVNIHNVLKVNIWEMTKYNLLKLSFICNFHNNIAYRN